MCRHCRPREFATHPKLEINQALPRPCSAKSKLHLLRHKVGRVETDAELPDHRDVAAGRHGLHEGLRPGLRDGAQVVDQLVLGHANARVPDRHRVVRLVRDDLDVEVRLGLYQ